VRTNHLVSFGFFVCVVCSTVAGEPEPVLTDAALQQILQKRIDGRKAVGLVVGRLQGTNRSVVAVGAMAVRSNRPVDGDTVFEIGSITKVFTGILLGDMGNRGEVQPNAPVTNYLPESVKVPGRNGHVITLAHLANHRSGLPREPDNLPPADKKRPYADYTSELLFKFLSTYELPRDPGSAYQYSNLGMGLLGDVLARRARTSYEQLVLDLICKPLGMHETRIKLSAEMQTRFATGHDYDLNPANNMDFLSLAGGGAFRSTANDFLKFLAAALNPEDDRLSKAIRASQAARTNTVGLNEEVAWAWHFKPVPDEILHHSGKTFGSHSFMGVNRKRNRAVVVFSNCQHGIDDIGMHLLDPRSELMPADKPVMFDEVLLERYVGTYTVTPTLEITVTREKSEMYIQATDQPKHEVFALARDQFFCEAGPLRLTFKTNAAGSVTELIVRQAGKEHRAGRK